MTKFRLPFLYHVMTRDCRLDLCIFSAEYVNIHASNVYGLLFPVSYHLKKLPDVI